MAKKKAARKASKATRRVSDTDHIGDEQQQAREMLDLEETELTETLLERIERYKQEVKSELNAIPPEWLELTVEEQTSLADSAGIVVLTGFAGYRITSGSRYGRNPGGFMRSYLQFASVNLGATAHYIRELESLGVPEALIASLTDAAMRAGRLCEAARSCKKRVFQRQARGSGKNAKLSKAQWRFVEGRLAKWYAGGKSLTQGAAANRVLDEIKLAVSGEVPIGWTTEQAVSFIGCCVPKLGTVKNHCPSI